MRRLAHGWRAAMLGEGIQELVAGKAGLTFERRPLKLIPVA